MPWPEPPERVHQRINGLVQSVLKPDEMTSLHLEWVTPTHDYGPDTWVVLRLTVTAIRGEFLQHEFWGPGWWCDWDSALADLASQLEDWVCETTFGWGEQRAAVVPE